MNGNWKRFLGALGCIVLVVLIVLVGTYFRAGESAENRKLESRASSLQAGGGEESVSGSSADTGVSGSSESGNAEETTAVTPAPIETPEVTPAAPRAVSCRGDAFVRAGTGGTLTYPQALQTILQQNGNSAEVKDYTWEMAGSLSQLYLAGIPETRLNEYIAKHRENADGESLSDTETQLRTDRSRKDLTRDDQDAVPVISMGYSGGWGKDPAELVEQIRLLLGTYSSQDDYVVMGYYPDGWTDQAGYDSAMTGAFGDHYLQLNTVLKHSAESNEGRREIAQALYNKLNELNYLSGN
jgi:hypothetical protein